MHIHALQLFLVTATLGSISKAAVASHISQPALTLQIQKLEYELGVTLFERSNKGVQLTEEGKILEKYAERFVALSENLRDDLTGLKSKRPIVRVVASPVVGIYALPCTMYNVKNAFPDHIFSMTIKHSEEAELAVLQGESDIGFINGPPQSGELFSAKVYTDKVTLVASADFRVKPRLTLDELRECPLVMYAPRSGLYKQMELQVTRKGRSLDEFRILFSLDSAESVKSSVLQSHGLAFLPYLAVKKELYLKQLREVKLADFALQHDVYIIYKQTAGMENTINSISEYFAKIVADTFC